MAYNKDFFEMSLKEIGQTAESLCRRGKSDEDAIAVASNLCHVAAEIYSRLGGHKLVAANFYAFADRHAVEDKT